MNSQGNINDKTELILILRDELPVLRAKARLSQEEVADRIGLSRQTLSAIETGKREMTWTTFLALITLFQNNENTRTMLMNIEGLADGIEKCLSRLSRKT